jgi:hypothetical protein
MRFTICPSKKQKIGSAQYYLNKKQTRIKLLFVPIVPDESRSLVLCMNQDLRSKRLVTYAKMAGASRLSSCSLVDLMKSDYIESLH